MNTEEMAEMLDDAGILTVEEGERISSALYLMNHYQSNHQLAAIAGLQALTMLEIMEAKEGKLDPKLIIKVIQSFLEMVVEMSSSIVEGVDIDEHVKRKLEEAKDE